MTSSRYQVEHSEASINTTLLVSFPSFPSAALSLSKASSSPSLQPSFSGTALTGRAAFTFPQSSVAQLSLEEGGGRLGVQPPEYGPVGIAAEDPDRCEDLDRCSEAELAAHHHTPAYEGGAPHCCVSIKGEVLVKSVAQMPCTLPLGKSDAIEQQRSREDHHLGSPHEVQADGLALASTRGLCWG